MAFGYGPGFSKAEPRTSPYPFYWRHQSPEILRWEWLHWNYEAKQRKFYQIMTGRTQGSIWMDECYPPDLMTGPDVNTKRAHASDIRSWSLPHLDLTTGYLGEEDAFSNYLELWRNYRPYNPVTKRAEDATDADMLYIAPRVTHNASAMRMDMLLPDETEIGANVLYVIGWEVNSQGNAAYAALVFRGGVGCNLEASQQAYWSHSAVPDDYGGMNLVTAPVTINNPGDWARYVLIWDPPVLRFIQPEAGQTDPWSYPDMTEISVASIPRTAVMQPHLSNESTTICEVATEPWYLGQWAIYPIYHSHNMYQINKRTNPDLAACGDYEVIFDTSGRGHILIHVAGMGTSQTYTIEWTGEGADQPAGEPEARTWRRIDDNDYTGNTDADGIASIGLFNAARFIRVTLDESAYEGCSNTIGTEQVVSFTANATAGDS